MIAMVSTYKTCAICPYRFGVRPETARKQGKAN